MTMRATGIPCDRTNAFIILGIRANDQPVSPEGAGILAIAWRCLYAEVTASRVEERRLDLNKALRRTLANSDLKGEGVRGKVEFVV